MTRIEKGDKVIVRFAVTDSDGNNVLFTSMADTNTTVKLEHADGTEYQTYTKGTDLVVGDNTNEIEFEVTVAHSQAFATGIIYALITIQLTDSDFSSSEAYYVEHYPLFRVQDKA